MKVILDMDTGIDDALAIAHAVRLAADENFEILGITTGYGNVLAETASKNTLNVLELLGRSDIPVYQGAECAWGKEEYHVSDLLYKIHGLDGLGNVNLGDPVNSIKEKPAEDFLIESALKYGEEMVLITTATMTNLANAMKMDEKAIRGIGKIVSMAGALTVPGNANRFAEANMLADPAAAKFVFESGLPITMVGLDVTFKTMLTSENIKNWKDNGSYVHQIFEKFTRYYYTSEFDDEKIGGAMHDALAVEVAIHPEIVRNTLPIFLTVETEGPSAGRTIGITSKLNEPEKNIQYCLDIDAVAFIKSFLLSLNRL